MSEQQQDTEIILGTGKLLGIFFVLVAVCGTFFGLGYALGRNSGPLALQNGTASTVNSSGAKPGAGVTASPPRVVASSPEVNTTAQVPQTAPSQPAAADETSANTQAVPSIVPVAASANPSTTTSEAASGGNITVQVAAVSKQEDAEVLVAALRRKNYPVFVAPGTSIDNLYHVQIGPFAELKDAEAMKGKLASDGYNAIVKK
jgi:cell division septation protein DedD